MIFKIKSILARTAGTATTKVTLFCDVRTSLNRPKSAVGKHSFHCGLRG
jgi:hypothetical protein